MNGYEEAKKIEGQINSLKQSNPLDINSLEWLSLIGLLAKYIKEIEKEAQEFENIKTEKEVGWSEERVQKYLRW